jgi:uncharacterized membrane protein YhdT
VNKPLVLRSVVLTLVLLPTSCLAGSMAADRLDARTSGFANSPLWYENVLWLVAVVLMLVWAWAIKRLWEAEN